MGRYVTPKHKIDIYKISGFDKEQVWRIFRKYHYLNTDLAKPAQQYIGIINGKIVCHTGIIQAPLRKGFKQVHRLVVLPDHQGIGIGTKFITFIAKKYAEENMTVKLITTTPAIRFALDRSKNWLLRRSGKVQPAGKTEYMKHWANSESSNRITYTYFYTEGVSCEKCGRLIKEGDGVKDDNKYYCCDDCLLESKKKKG